MGKKATPSYKIVWVMEFEQERIPGLEGFEGPSPARLPEINLVDALQLGKEIEPVIIGNADKGLQVYLSPFFSLNVETSPRVSRIALNSLLISPRLMLARGVISEINTAPVRPPC